jgi:DNA processing protein
MPEAENDLLYKIALTLIPNIGPVLARNLVSYRGGVEKIFNATKQQLIKVPGIGEKTADEILHFKDFKRAEKEVDFIKKNKITTFFYLDENYPWRLKNSPDAPILLYFKGNANLNAERHVAIVGTRTATDYGKSFCEKLVEDLKKYNVTILSGLAYGIDICAHRTAVKNEMPTIGIVAHGLDDIYPGQHRNTAAQMIKNGGVLTEYITDTKADRENFPMRNRIIAGLADAVVVVETAAKGGSMITAEIGYSYNKDIFALPGDITNEKSRGCNFLIKTNKAVLLESGDELAFNMGWIDLEKKPAAQKKLFVDLSDNEKTIVDLLQAAQQLPIDELTLQSRMSASVLASALLELELKSVVRSLPGKMYKLN